MTIKTREQLHLDMANERALIVINNAAKTLRRAAEEMDRHAERLKGNDGSVKPENILGWAINSVSCLHSNMRVDLFVDVAAELAEARTLARRSDA